MINWIKLIVIAMFGALQMHGATLEVDKVSVIAELQFGVQRFIKDGSVVRKIPTDATLLLRLTNLSPSVLRLPTQRIVADLEEIGSVDYIRLRLDIPDGSQSPVVIVPEVILGIAELRPNETVVIPIQLEKYSSKRGVPVNVTMKISDWVCRRYNLDYFNFASKIANE